MFNHADRPELMIVSDTALGYGCSVNCAEGMFTNAYFLISAINKNDSISPVHQISKEQNSFLKFLEDL
jgi:hypothetical protein